MTQWPVLWESEDGRAWTAAVVTAFGLAVEATVNDIAIADDTVVAVGLVAEEAGTSVRVAWVLGPGDPWAPSVICDLVKTTPGSPAPLAWFTGRLAG